MTHCRHYFESLFYVTFLFIKKKREKNHNEKKKVLNALVLSKPLICCGGTGRISIHFNSINPFVITASILYIAAATLLQDWVMPTMNVQ